MGLPHYSFSCIDALRAVAQKEVVTRGHSWSGDLLNVSAEGVQVRLGFG
jgi:hypothetical protein